MPSPDDALAFVIVVERGPLEWQSVLLVDSLRRWGGRLADATVHCVSPRPDRLPRPEIREELQGLGAVWVEGVHNPDASGYGPANRIVAGGHVERTTRYDVLVMVDSDTLVLAPPDELDLPADVDVAARPVDLAGASTTTPDDAFASYWAALCSLAGTELSALPRVTTSASGQDVVANYNAGLVAVRRERGILAHLERVYFDALADGLRPRPGARTLRTGTGFVTPEVAELWGSAQVALSVAIWSRTRRVRELTPGYNVPLHKLDHLSLRGAAVHVHYHWLLDPGEPPGPLRDGRIPLSADQSAWLEDRLSWRDTTLLSGS